MRVVGIGLVQALETVPNLASTHLIPKFNSTLATRCSRAKNHFRKILGREFSDDIF